MTIGEVSIILGEMLVFLIKAVTELIQAAVLILNPIKIVNDSITGIFMVQNSSKHIIIFTTTKQKHMMLVNQLEKVYLGLEEKGMTKENWVRGKQPRGAKCMKPRLLSLIITMICPPLGLFLHMGSSGWFHVIICTVLTVYAYYFQV